MSGKWAEIYLIALKNSFPRFPFLRICYIATSTTTPQMLWVVKLARWDLLQYQHHDYIPKENITWQRFFYPWIWNSSLLCHYHALYGKHFFDTCCINSTEYKEEELVVAKNFAKLKSLFLFQCQRVMLLIQRRKKVLFIDLGWICLLKNIQFSNEFFDNITLVSNPW